MVERFKLPIPVLHGRGLFNYDIGLMPYRQEVNVVVGKPIQVNQLAGSRPFQVEIDRYHGLYIDEMKRLYAAYKDQFYSGEAAQLRMIS